MTASCNGSPGGAATAPHRAQTNVQPVASFLYSPLSRLSREEAEAGDFPSCPDPFRDSDIAGKARTYFARPALRRSNFRFEGKRRPICCFERFPYQPTVENR
ncbi:hypothetical protein [Bradyrhizobium sp.]|uniref:hypothetical protein n=1 Tax=Bradyrhizobium sp. TaxID=376 RepID=UPI00403790F6